MPRPAAVPDQDPLVSVIVLNWNGKEDLEECLQSLSEQDYSNYEIIVVDNASTDGSVEMLKNYPYVKVIVNAENLGFAEGNNVGIRESRGELIALLNNDATADRRWLSELVKTMREDQEIGMAGGIIYHSPERARIWSAGAKIDLLTGYIWHIRETHEGDLIEDFDYIPACAIIVRRKTIEKIGYLDKEYFIYSEDAEWGINAKRAGFKTVLNLEAKTWHKSSSTMRKLPIGQYYYLTRNRIRFIIKNFPAIYLLTTLLCQTLLNLPYELIVLRLDERHLLQKIRAVLWNLENLKETIEGRKRNLSLGPDHLKIRLSELINRFFLRGKEVT